MTSRLPARDPHAPDDGRCIQRIGACRVAPGVCHDACFCVALPSRWSCPLGSRWPSQQTPSHRTGSV